MSMLKKLQARLLLLSLFGVVVFGGSCTEVRDATQVIDNGIADLKAEGTDITNVLQGVAKSLPEDVAEVIREEAQQLATRSVANVGMAFRCNVDFLRHRAEESLERLKRWIRLKKEQPPLPPALCSVAPESVDLSTDPKSWDTITLHGYDMDHRDSEGNLLGFSLKREGALPDIPLSEDAIGRTTHYQITISLRGLANTLHDEGIVKGVPRWNGSIAGTTSGEILVKKWTADRETLAKDVGKTTHTPKKVHGDYDFDTGGNDPMDVYLEAKIKNAETVIEGRVYMAARETKGDHTEVKEWSDWEPLYTAPKGWKIIDVKPNASSKHRFKITSHGMKTINRPGGEVLDRFNVWGDHGGDDAESYTKVEADWRKLQIALEEIAPSWYPQ